MLSSLKKILRKITNNITVKVLIKTNRNLRKIIYSYGNTITVELDLNKLTKVIKRENKTLSGKYLDTGQPTSMLYIYPHVIDLFVRKNANILVMGGGACVYPSYAISKNPSSKITVIENDKNVINAVNDQFPVPKNKNLKLLNSDAYNWIKKDKKTYDLIFVDTGIQYSPSLNLRKNLFFLNTVATQNYKKHLNKNGILLINVISTLTADDQNALSNTFEKFTSILKNKIKLKITPGADTRTLQDLLFLFSNRKINKEILTTAIQTATEDRLPYPKNILINIIKSIY